jgi:hypothetical protein
MLDAECQSSAKKKNAKADDERKGEKCIHNWQQQDSNVKLLERKNQLPEPRRNAHEV